ncbi:DUF2272 domain-containing protein (plasmid) [Agrobacterium sp. rho-13.3]|uniref:DUF2272 domain-containing protein n=1 Tax=Agrobacterium sp. rho-13.3 TaxID=3072980 RepID=UPI002A0E0629|nr:DUF2272 domain-containing protein [Agrobacterium sp. rho-13.3]MDX8311950.1 DUF2272 domain-containing protein [Agrobacterium sp. rho-13.3]
MTPFVTELVNHALSEWAYFGYSTRALNDNWKIGAEEYEAGFRSRVTEYWKVVGHPTWDGLTKQPWSGAFISWCFEEANAGGHFQPSAKHSVYINWIRKQKSSNAGLQLTDPAASGVAVGDLIWNSRRDSSVSSVPKTYAEAVSALTKGVMFNSHVDIVVEIGSGQCDSIGGNVSNNDPGGSVTRSTWKLDTNGKLIDSRKSWIGVVKNSL